MPVAPLRPMGPVGPSSQLRQLMQFGQFGPLGRWAAPLILGLLTMVGCAGDGELAVEESVTQPVDPGLPPEPTIPAACAGATLDAPHAVRATGDVRTDGLPIYDPAVLDTAAIQARIDACGASLPAGHKGSVRLQVSAQYPS